MPAFREGRVKEIVQERHALQRARVELEDPREEILVSCYDALQPLEAGDRVIVNTTGLELGLGTGGEGFVLWVEGAGRTYPGEGHIMKMRYTPLQTEVLASEAPESPHHALLRDADDLTGCPVVACGLHSQIAGVAAGVKAARPTARVAYVMSDGGALPIAWSDLVAGLKDALLLDSTVTYGHAFGGDVEAVNVFTALLAARLVAEADVVVAAMGPGGVGTGTRLGYTGIEQAQVLDATTALKGRPVGCLRISFSDPRDRHEGISHHSLTSLRLTGHPVTVAVPELPDAQRDLVAGQLQALEGRTRVVAADGEPGLELLRQKGITPESMGRSIDASPEPFLAAAAAGAVAASMLEG